MEFQCITYTPKQIELSRRLPYQITIVRAVFELLEDDTKAEALLETTAKLGIDPVEIAELVYEVKNKKRKWPKKIRPKKHDYITVPGSAVVITTLNRTGEKRRSYPKNRAPR